MTTASASREVAFPRSRVWRALAVLQPYCAVCDVSYVLDGADTRMGTQFVCVPGKDHVPGPGAPRGEIIEWEPDVRVATRLELTPETWTTTIELADAADGGTNVTISLTQQSRREGRLRRRLPRLALRKLVRETIDAELAKVTDHVEQADQAMGGLGAG